MEVVETQHRCSNTETNSGEGRRTMKDIVTSTEIETWDDNNRGGVYVKSWG